MQQQSFLMTAVLTYRHGSWGIPLRVGIGQSRCPSTQMFDQAGKSP
jgi:hypothetical protein